MRIPIAIDLFSGCGGLTTGLIAAGFDVIAGAEIRPEARAAYLLNHPKAHLFEDVKMVSLDSLNGVYPIKAGELDLLAACPPCQGFSTLRTLNKEAPATDDRNKLIFQVSRLVKELKPKAVLVENVPGLMTNWRFKDFRRRISKMGYRTAQTVLDAADFGVPQRRRRMILIAVRSKSEPTLPKPDSTIRLTVRSVLESLPHHSDQDAPALHRVHQKLSEKVLKRVRDVPLDGGSRAALGKKRQLKCHVQKKGQKPRGFNDVYGRMAWDKVAPTMTRFCHNPSKGRFIHPEEHRGITLYEALLLQGFPKDYKIPAELGIGKSSSLIGEAFPPPFAKAQALHVRSLLETLF